METQNTQEIVDKAHASLVAKGVLKSEVLSKAEKPNSYEFGRAGDRFKLYFDTAEELKAQIDKLKELGLYSSIEND